MTLLSILKNSFHISGAYPSRYILYIFIGILCFSACSTEKKDPSPETDWVSWAVASEKYIQHAKYQSDNGTTWKMMPDSLHSKGNKTLYNGTPGIVLFYLELFHATNNANYLEEAKDGAGYLISSLPDTIPGIYDVGLYTGLAGMGFTFTEIFKVTRDNNYKNAALKTVSLLEAASERSENGIHWGQINDIVYGSAGIGLYLHYIADEFNSEKADSLSIQVAEGLLDSAVDTLGGLRWKFFPEDKIYMDNFSHGTSGVAYFLVQAYKRTQHKKYLDAAIKAAALLDIIKNDKGYIPHHLPGGEELYYLNWCHGPAGTSRLYYALYETTKDSTWHNTITQQANNMMKEGIATQQKPGFWNNVGKCCGATGVAEYYLWLYQVTGNNEYLQFSTQMTQAMMAKATRNGELLKWIHAGNRRSPDQLAAQSGLMQGSAGMGLWFLELHAHQLKKEPLIHLPDKPKNHVKK